VKPLRVDAQTSEHVALLSLPVCHRYFTAPRESDEKRGRIRPCKLMLVWEIIMSTESASLGVDVFVSAHVKRPLRKRLIDTLIEWRRRIRSRREFAALSARELKDIGYPAEIAAEKAKPFWRA